MAEVVVDDRRVGATGGVSLHVRVTAPAPGSAPGPLAGLQVLCVHGLASNARMWDGVATHLADRGAAVAAVDQRGHGTSDAPDGGYDFATLTADLVTVLDDLGWDRPAVAGQSWGGNVVVELAARHPDRVGSLVLVDGGTIELQDRFADWPTCEAALTPPPIAGMAAADFEAMIRSRHPDWPEAGVQGTLANMEVRPDGTVAPHLSLPHHLAILRGLWEHRPSQRWPALDLPVLVLSAGDPAARGRYDVAKREEVDRAARLLRHGRVEWIDGDHDLHAQHPDRVADLVAATAHSPLEPR